MPTSLWNDPRFRSVSPFRPSGQALYLYLLTGPVTSILPGVVADVGILGLAEKLRWPVEEVRRCAAELEQAGLVEADWESLVIWLPQATRDAPPKENKNQVLAWRSAWAEVPECELKRKVALALRPLAARFPGAADEVFGGAGGRHANSSANCSPNQEQEQGQENTPLTPLSGGGEVVTPSGQKRPAADDPEGAQAARRVMAHFKKAVGSAHHAGGAQVRLLELLHAGVAESRLLAACDGYAAHCRRAELAPNKRQGAGKFFSAEGAHAEFLDYVPPPPPPRPAALDLRPLGTCPRVNLKGPAPARVAAEQN